MKSCQIVPSLEARHGGPSRSVLNLAKALVQCGSQVDLLTTDPGAPWERSEEGVDIRAFHRNWPGKICASMGLRTHLASVETDLVHHHSLWLRTLHYAHRAARARSVPLVLSPRGMMDRWAWRHRARRKTFARTFIHPGAFEAVDGWHATSPREAEDIRSLGFQQPICVAPNGVSAPSASEQEAAAEHWRKLIPASRQKPVALFYSRFHKKKRVLELIDLWREFGSDDWLLLLVGIPEEFSPQKIENYVLNTGQTGRIRAIDGLGHPPPYGIASLFVLPSHGENFGLSIAEALAHGVPAVVTDTTPWLGLNAQGAGKCVPWNGYGEALREALSTDTQTLRRMGTCGRDWVLSEFSWEGSARKLLKFYASLQSGKKGTSR